MCDGCLQHIDPFPAGANRELCLVVVAYYFDVPHNATGLAPCPRRDEIDCTTQTIDTPVIFCIFKTIRIV